MKIDGNELAILQNDLDREGKHQEAWEIKQEFLRQVSPEIALISVGNNSYGHPHMRVLEELTEIGADVYRTDESGCMTIWLQGNLRADTFLH